jgi:hypothetical protein
MSRSACDFDGRIFAGFPDGVDASEFLEIGKGCVEIVRGDSQRRCEDASDAGTALCEQLVNIAMMSSDCVMDLLNGFLEGRGVDDELRVPGDPALAVSWEWLWRPTSSRTPHAAWVPSDGGKARSSLTRDALEERFDRNAGADDGSHRKCHERDGYDQKALEDDKTI